jgi:hypothetical protein
VTLRPGRARVATKPAPTRWIALTSAGVSPGGAAGAALCVGAVRFATVAITSRGRSPSLSRLQFLPECFDSCVEFSAQFRIGCVRKLVSNAEKVRYITGQ